MLSEVGGPFRYAFCSYGRFMLVVLEPSGRPYVLVETGTEFVVGLKVG